MKTNTYGYVRSEGTQDNVVAKKTYLDKKGCQKHTSFKVIVDGKYCAIMYCYILEQYGFIRSKSSFKGNLVVISLNFE